MNNYDEYEALLDSYISDLFLRMNASAIMSGYYYALTAVKYVVKNGAASMMKEVYPYVAEVHGATVSRVERNIRHFVKVIWIRERTAEINKVFGGNVYNKRIKPTNSDFIYLIAEKASAYYYVKIGKYKYYHLPPND